MFPYIDSAASTGATVQATAVKRPEFDKIAETYQTPRMRDNGAFEETDNSARPAEKVGTRSITGPRRDTAVQRKVEAKGDQAAINFQMSREEREVFLSAMTGRERVSDMSEDEQKLMEKSAERLDKLIEAADARDTASRERMDKAVKEWYIRLANGKQPPTNLLTLIRQAAEGKLD
jgi:hypothetical protein